MSLAEPQLRERAGGEPSGGRRARRRVLIDGIVQGVGFRPFVWSLATRLGLGGFIANDTRGVVIEVEGDEPAVARFVERLSAEAPMLAVVESASHAAIAPKGQSEFTILPSHEAGERGARVSPDAAMCADCLREIFDPADRRYHYPFTNCTNCEPRFTIVRGVPYDRERTTMAAFPMCRECWREYRDPADRRLHTQATCCPACGPRLRLLDCARRPQKGDPIERAAELVQDGKIVAIKGLGGYHLAARAGDELTVRRLRFLKHREEKPFAVMVPDLETAARIAEVEAAQERLLSSPRRPIVLLRKDPGHALADSVAPGNCFVKLMLPYTPLHHLLSRRLGRPFVLTSANASDEPIAHRDEEAFARLSAITDFFLTHDRAIHLRADDSVFALFRGRKMPVRRARGYAPAPLILPFAARRPIPACGAELKNTFCLGKGRYAFVSQHIGDLENFESLRAFTEGVEHFRRLFDVQPEVVAFDLHPEYLSTKFALELENVERVAVQPHHAHIASCLAENGEEGLVIGVAFDGLGYGTDGTFWGGEFLAANLMGFERAGYLRPVPMPGGAAAIKQPWRMAAAYLDAAYGEDVPADLGVVARHRKQWRTVVALARSGFRAPLTSSAGRLFDALAAILDIRDTVDYEGQAAVEMEQWARSGQWPAYPVPIDEVEPFEIDGVELIRAAVDDLRSGAAADSIAARFHAAVAAIIVEGCRRIRARRGLSDVALSGGVFQNQLLLAQAAQGLEDAGFRVLTHSRVPPNDGGISLDQLAVAAAWDSRGARSARALARGGISGQRKGARRWAH